MRLVQLVKWHLRKQMMLSMIVKSSQSPAPNPFTYIIVSGAFGLLGQEIMQMVSSISFLTLMVTLAHYCNVKACETDPKHKRKPYLLLDYCQVMYCDYQYLKLNESLVTNLRCLMAQRADTTLHLMSMKGYKITG